MSLIPCRVTTNIVGARAGERTLVDPEDPKVALHIEKGYLVPDGDPVVTDDESVTEAVTESGDGTGGEGDADETLETDAAVGDDAEAPLEPVGDSSDEDAFTTA